MIGDQIIKRVRVIALYGPLFVGQNQVNALPPSPMMTNLICIHIEGIDKVVLAVKGIDELQSQSL